MAHLIHQVERDFSPSSSSANRGTTPMHNATNLIDVQAPSSSGGLKLTWLWMWKVLTTQMWLL
uniref:Uncharacterized protein n=1 Tax=Oryza nivara TaxID=4536 RepID=A0A0E0IAS3_ORYNI